MISHNIKRAEKKLWTNNDMGDLIGFRLEYDGEAEANFVTQSIRDERSRFTLQDIAIFYRTNSQSRLMEEALRAENIPYQIYGGTRFYDRMEIKDLLAYLRLMVNESDDVSFRRVVNVPSRKIGPKALEYLESTASQKNQSLFKTLGELSASNDLNLPDKLKRFHAMVLDIKKEVQEKPLSEILEFVVQRVEYFDYLRKKFSQEEAVDKIENINELGTAMTEFDKRNPGTTLAGWLQVITLTNTSDEESAQGVAMMTLHMAKGLEFKRVYVVGVEEGILPHGNNVEDDELLEEERRLFYVGMTRARQKLTISAAYRRRMYDRWMSNKPSRFIKEIPQKFLDVGKDRWSSMLAGISDRPSAEYESGSVQVQSGAVKRLAKGASVFHPTYGKGIIEAINQEAAEINVEVNFSEFGRRFVKSQHLLMSAE
jgi:DNA helicase-2/ATP-dependent DNA helicase PcrA